MIALGIDPGSGTTPGAAVCCRVDGTRLRVIRAVAWRRVGDVVRCRVAGEAWAQMHAEDVPPADLPRMAMGWATWMLDSSVHFVAVEGIFAVARQTHGIVQLAEHAGAMVEAARRVAPAVDCRRPPASQWRPHQLGIPARTPADRAEEIAIQRAEQVGMVDPAWHAPHRGGYTLAEWGAVCEAAWIAREGVTWRIR